MIDLETVEVFEMAYDKFQRGNAIYFGDSPDEIVAKVCPNCRKCKWLEDFWEDKSNNYGRDAYCIKCRSEGHLRELRRESTANWMKNNPTYGHKRRTTIRGLPYDFPKAVSDRILKQFNHSCALTGDNYTWDHAIPVDIGHGGTVECNMYPLRGDLNTSKSNRNIFEWFKYAKHRFNLSQTKFDELIEYLAKVNDMTVQEYRDYVYWCHDNPRTVEDITAG